MLRLSVILRANYASLTKDYGAKTFAEQLDAAARNQENAKTYWLVKNGERLHRIYADIFVGPRLLPKEDELDHFFFVRERGTTAASEPVAVRPGSPEYMNAMEKAGAVKRHFMRLALVLQGLIDRTQLFAPFKDATRPNLLDPEGNADTVHFLRDVEGTLTDGRPSFREWQAGVNASLAHGHRVVGSFSSYYRERDGEEPRVWPNGASGYDADEAFVVTERKGTFYFNFKRTDTVYRRLTYFSSRQDDDGEAKTAGRYRLERDDTTFLCLDGGVTVADMEYYLNDRRHRSAYESMVPCLQRAIRILNAETAAEAPFRELLLRKLSEAAPDHPCTPERLDSLVRWWKTKTREHRALLADDAKAYRMIVARYVSQVVVPTAEQDRAAVMAMLGRSTDALYAYHIGGREYGVLRRVNGEAHWVREETWRVTKGTAHLVATVPFVLPRKALYESYERLYVSPAWAAVPSSYSVSRFVAPDRIADIVAVVRSKPPLGGSDDGKKKLLAIYGREDEHGIEIRVAVADFDRDGGGWARSSDPIDALSLVNLPDVRERKLVLNGRKQLDVSYESLWSTATYLDHRSSNADTMTLHKGWEKEGSRLYFLDEEVLADVLTVAAERTTRNARAVELRSWGTTIREKADSFLKVLWRERMFGKYVQEGGTVDLFEDHLKTLRKPQYNTSPLSQIAERALKAGMPPAKIIALPLPEFISTYSVATDEDSRADMIAIDEEVVRLLTAASWKLPAFPGAGE